MISAGQYRRTATLWLMSFVVLCGQMGAAAVCTLNQHGPVCSLHAHVRVPPVSAKTVAAGCCPAHSVANSQCPSHPVRVAATDDQDCCVLSKQPARPLALLLSDSSSHSVQAAATAAAPETLASSIKPPNPANAPFFVKPVFDLKTDLRI